MVPPLCLLAIPGLPSHFSLISVLGNGQFYLSVSSAGESTLFLMHPASVFPGPFPHTPIVCRTIRDLAGELIQEHNLFQTKCTLFPPGQLNRNKSIQNHWPEAKHFPSWKHVWWLSLWTTSALPGAVGWAASPQCSLAVCSGTGGWEPVVMVFLSVWHAPVWSSLKECLQEWSPCWKKWHRCLMKLSLSQMKRHRAGLSLFPPSCPIVCDL